MRKTEPFYYSRLSRHEQEAYDILFNGLMDHKSSISFPMKYYDNIFDILVFVCSDYPELFYVDTKATFGTDGRHAYMKPSYTVETNAIGKMWGDIEAAYSDYEQRLPNNPTDWDKALIAYEFLIERCEYTILDRSFGIYSALCNNNASCTEYSAAYEFLLKRSNVPCGIIHGNAGKKGKGYGPHAWNIVCIDGKWGWVDVTWGDPIMNGKDQRYRSYDYFMAGDNLFSTHNIDKMEKRLIPKTTAQSWYEKNNLYFVSYDTQQITSALQGYALGHELSMSSGSDDYGQAMVQFSNAKAYKAAKEDLGSGSGFRRALAPVFQANGKNASYFKWAENDDMLTISATYTISWNY